MTEERLRMHIEGNSRNAHSPFKVPDGYFDSLCDRIMNQLPEAEESPKPKMWILQRRALWRATATAAACLLAALITTVTLHHQQEKPAETISATITEEICHAYEDEAYVDEALDYAMIENHEIAAYLTTGY